MAAALPVGIRAAELAVHDLVRSVVNGTTWITETERPNVLVAVAASLTIEALKLRGA